MSAYFIYYKVAQGHRHAAVAAVADLQSRVFAQTGVAGRLVFKDDGSDTWMEIYEGVRDQARFESALSQSTSQLQFDRLLVSDSQRHVERFVETLRT